MSEPLVGDVTPLWSNDWYSRPRGGVDSDLTVRSDDPEERERIRRIGKEMNKDVSRLL